MLTYTFKGFQIAIAIILLAFSNKKFDFQPCYSVLLHTVLSVFLKKLRAVESNSQWTRHLWPQMNVYVLKYTGFKLCYLRFTIFIEVTEFSRKYQTPIFSEKTIINYMNSSFCYIQYLLNLFLIFFCYVDGSCSIFTGL